jgi:hypothetical protein
MLPLKDMGGSGFLSDTRFVRHLSSSYEDPLKYILGCNEQVYLN